MKYLLVSVCLLLSACATPPSFLANYFDRGDPCQTRLKEPGYQIPSACGGSGRVGPTYVTRDYRTGNYIATTQGYTR